MKDPGDRSKAEGLLLTLIQNGRFEDGIERNVRAIVGFIEGIRLDTYRDVNRWKPANVAWQVPEYVAGCPECEAATIHNHAPKSIGFSIEDAARVRAGQIASGQRRRRR